MSDYNRAGPSSAYSHSTPSIYTLDTMNNTREFDDERDADSERSSLMAPETPSYGATFPRSPAPSSTTRVVFNATLKMAVIFAISTLFLGGTLWLALPTLEPDDRQFLVIPKSFQQLKELNVLLKKYRDIYPYRIFICYVTTYLFLQAFSLPGSMYLSILGGAVWGVARALPLACCCVATGATLCYLISAALGPALLTLPKWKAKLDKWSTKIRANKDNMISFLIVLRIAPLPPHWVVNVICPHVGIGIVPFWISTALGILGVSVIHTTIGGGLDDMTSADDFHIISWRNFFGLSAVVVGVMIPVGLRYWFGREAEIVEEEVEEEIEEEAEDRIIAVGPPPVSKYSTRRPLLQTGENAPLQPYSSDEDDDDDVILESGPLIDIKPGDDNRNRDTNLIILDSSTNASSSTLPRA